MPDINNFSKLIAVIICIIVLIAVAHVLRIGSYLEGRLYNLYYGYFSDFVLPFGYYFLLCASEVNIPFLQHWGVKSAIVFLLPSIAETCQYFGIPVLGSTFDPLDYFMYGMGALTAVLLERQVFTRMFSFWNLEKVQR